ncbi:MAG: NAD(P)H-dependent oxidoreductase [Candidatus Protistobacter heckmanni]|nr:NAD(P)H-dependent oxidoreductase [Candidatus Protistobacter heckmanni]
MAKPRILLFAGSSRKDSFARRTANAAAPILAAAGAEVTHVELADYPMPVYNGDDEAANGLPETVKQLRKLIAEHDAILVASPEYNGSMTPLLVNTIDWCSRQDPRSGDKTPGTAIYADKPAAMISSSLGPLGGMRALFHLRDLLGYLGMIVIPQQVAVGSAMEAFTPEGGFARPKDQAMVEGVTKALVAATSKLRG